jgi:hypothetical protein
MEASDTGEEIDERELVGHRTPDEEKRAGFADATDCCATSSKFLLDT